MNKLHYNNTILFISKSHTNIFNRVFNETKSDYDDYVRTYIFYISQSCTMSENTFESTD